MAKGMKVCPGCNKEVGAKTKICGCGFDFSTISKSEKVVKSLDPADITDKSQMRGKKLCPGCNKIIGARTYVCPLCSYEFSISKKENENVEKIEEIEDIKEIENIEKTDNIEDDNLEAVETLVSMIPDEVKKKIDKVKAVETFASISPTYIDDEMEAMNHKKSSIRHAQRILSYGRDRASFLLSQSRGTWGHVDWKYVEEKLKEEI